MIGGMITSKRFIKARKAVGETQTTFAARFGVDQSTVHRWETNGVPDRGTAAFAVEHVIREIESQLAGAE
jgi:DNA-binding transcriptional regulator YiaG